MNEGRNANKSCFTIWFSKMTSRMTFQKKTGFYFLFLLLHNLNDTIHGHFLLCLTLRGTPMMRISTAIGKRRKATFWQVFTPLRKYWWV